MTREEVEKLATLARIELTPREVETFTKELSDIVTYVSAVQELAGEAPASSAPALGVRYNVFRTDEVTNAADEYTADALAEMPQTEGRHMVVKKILQID